MLFNTITMQTIQVSLIHWVLCVPQGRTLHARLVAAAWKTSKVRSSIISSRISFAIQSDAIPHGAITLFRKEGQESSLFNASAIDSLQGAIEMVRLHCCVETQSEQRVVAGPSSVDEALPWSAPLPLTWTSEVQIWVSLKDWKSRNQPNISVSMVLNHFSQEEGVFPVSRVSLSFFNTLRWFGRLSRSPNGRSAELSTLAGASPQWHIEEADFGVVCNVVDNVAETTKVHHFLKQKMFFFGRLVPVRSFQSHTSPAFVDFEHVAKKANS